MLHFIGWRLYGVEQQFSFSLSFAPACSMKFIVTKSGEGSYRKFTVAAFARLPDDEPFLPTLGADYDDLIAAAFAVHAHMVAVLSSRSDKSLSEL